MPTYDYQCRSRKCGKITSVFQSMAARRLTRCPRCKTGRATRLIGSGSGLIFKGTGFYITDYRKSGDTKKDKGGDSSSSKSDKK